MAASSTNFAPLWETMKRQSATTYTLQIKGGKTSTAIKNRYNAKAYDQIPFRVKKGKKEVIQKRAEKICKSVNSYITDLIAEDLNNPALSED